MFIVHHLSKTPRQTPVKRRQFIDKISFPMHFRDYNSFLLTLISETETIYPRLNMIIERPVLSNPPEWTLLAEDDVQVTVHEAASVYVDPKIEDTKVNLWRQQASKTLVLGVEFWHDSMRGFGIGLVRWTLIWLSLQPSSPPGAIYGSPCFLMSWAHLRKSIKFFSAPTWYLHKKK